MNLVQKVAPLSEPLSLEDAKTFMHILENDEDTLIESFISGAREYAENYTNRQLIRLLLNSAIIELFPLENDLVLHCAIFQQHQDRQSQHDRSDGTRKIRRIRRERGRSDPDNDRQCNQQDPGDNTSTLHNFTSSRKEGGLVRPPSL